MPRALPLLGQASDRFWTAGAEGSLEILRCSSCELWLHPPVPVCWRCANREVGFQTVSGEGRVHAFTVNHQRWRPDMDVPFVVASVELVEQTGLYLTTNIVDCDVDRLHRGMEVTVAFLNHDDVWLPVFAPNTKEVVQ